MIVWEIIFLFSCFCILYNYVGYAIIAMIFNGINKTNKKEIRTTQNSLPTISFVVAAYNEEDFIQLKIKNCLSLKYPFNKIEFIFVADGSTDKTAEIIAENKLVKLMFERERKGKSAAMNRAVLEAKNEILIFSDANTILNEDAITNIAKHYSQKKVGGVAGEKKIISPENNENEVGEGEGLYWKYESFLKKTDSQFYSVVGAAGELFSLRKNLYEPMAKEVILDDFVTTLKIAQKGYRIIYEPEAYAMELPSFSIEEEKKRKIRIAAGGFQAMVILKGLLLFWRTPKLSFLYISHRVLRWTLSPFCLFTAFISNAILFFIDNNIIFKISFLLQLLFYIFALSAPYFNSKKRILKLFNICYYFVFMNLSVVQGFFRFIQGKQASTWEKAKRSSNILR